MHHYVRSSLQCCAYTCHRYASLCQVIITVLCIYMSPLCIIMPGHHYSVVHIHVTVMHHYARSSLQCCAYTCHSYAPLCQVIITVLCIYMSQLCIIVPGHHYSAVHIHVTVMHHCARSSLQCCAYTCHSYASLCQVIITVLCIYMSQLCIIMPGHHYSAVHIHVTVMHHYARSSLQWESLELLLKHGKIQSLDFCTSSKIRCSKATNKVQILLGYGHAALRS